MIARELVDVLGKTLKGRKVFTQAVGDWPGGNAIVTKIGNPDDDSIVFEVESCNKRVNKQFGVMGVFEDEECKLVGNVIYQKFYDCNKQPYWSARRS